jgi:hypothetical protein
MSRNTIRIDRAWKGGCETINMTGKRAGKLCNGNFYRTKTVNGRQIKCCYSHLDGSYQDVENEESFCDEGADDEINESDVSFIAPEDDGTVLLNGKVFGKVENSQTDAMLERERENHYEYELSYLNSAFDDAETETESEYKPEETDEETETEVDDEMEFEAQQQDVFDDKMEFEAENQNEVFDAETEAENQDEVLDAEDEAEAEAEDEDEYYIKYMKEKEKSRNLEVLLTQERKKLDEYKKIFEKNMNEEKGFTQVVETNEDGDEDADAHNEETFGKEASELDVVKSKLEKLENTVHDLSKFIRDIFSSADKYSL